MKKNFYYLSLMLGLVFGMTMFTACGGDDDDDYIGDIQQPTKEWRVCVTCGGSKLHAECSGSGRCQECNGNGSYTKKCVMCSGNGYIIGLHYNKTCTSCGGTGSTTYSCSTCSSTGKCKLCSGTGKCHICNGEGGYYVETSSYGGGGSGGSYDDDDDNDDATAGWEVSALGISYSSWSHSYYTSTTTLWMQPDIYGRIGVYSSSSKSTYYGWRKDNTNSSYGGYDVSGYSYYVVGNNNTHYYFN